ATLRVGVFVDENNNGEWGKNEASLDGATITLLTRTNGEELTVTSAVTGPDGQVTLNAPEGDYILRCELPADYGYAKKGSKAQITHSAMTQSEALVQELSVTLTCAQAREIGVGAARMATLMGSVWLDLNGDGLWNDDEPGFEGMTITAEGVRNGLTYETVTDAEGNFVIRQIRNGTYNVTYFVPDGYCFTVKASSSKGLRSQMTTEADRKGTDQIIFDKGEVVDGQIIGLMQEAVVEGYCFLDANYNGYFDEGEEVLPGVELELYRQSNNKRLQTVVSDENGYYRFGNVRGDTFKVKALLPKDTTYSVSIPGDANANQFAPRENRREQTVTGIAAVSGESVTLMVGAIQYGSVSGVVYEDTNFSGDWETGEKVVQGLVVTLLDSEGETLKSVKTGSSGAFTFDGLTPGTYQLRMAAKAGYAFTKTGDGNVMANTDKGMGESEPFTVALGEKKTGMDIGMIVPAVVTGTVFADANDNGLYDAGEKGLAGTRVSLMQENGEVASLTVEGDGTFAFDTVMPGRYYLRYELPENGVFSPRVTGGNAVVGEGSDGAGDWFTVSSGETWTAPVCGGLDLGIIEGYVYSDSNGSGVMDAEEAMMAGVTLVLTPSRSDLTETTLVTGADGAFAFEALRPDTYTLTLTCPDGYVLSRLEDVKLGLQSGLAEQTIALTVGMGTQWTSQALGCVMPSSYSGSAWLDENLNGLREDGEKPAAGRVLTLADQITGETVMTLTTDENGEFTAQGLAPGLYRLTYALPGTERTSGQGDTTFTEDCTMLVMEGIAIEEGSVNAGAVLGLVQETKLGGCVWLDAEGETEPVAQAQVTLTAQDGTVTTVQTGADGKYAFVGLMPGEYVISVVLPDGYVALEPGDSRLESGERVSILAQCLGSEGSSAAIALRMAEDQLQLDIGCVLPGRLGDRCWLDLNANGLQDAGEGGLPGIEIHLVRNGSIVASAVSDQYGYFMFKNIYPGEYTLQVVWPDEVKPTTLRTDLPNIVSVLTEDGVSIPVFVESDGRNYNADLGFVLVNADKLPAGYGEGATQNWKFN
ncbi:MAG: SdrD B-like domain-containing protein, partial [Aristaeellaceae bacterium]